MTVAAASVPAAVRQVIAYGVERIHIPKRNGLDPITVFAEDFGNGQGRLTITCWSSAWVCFWGAMGRPLAEFVTGCDKHYVAGNMLTGRRTVPPKNERDYVERVAQEVIDAFKQAQPSQSQELRTPDGWLIRRACGEEISVMAPNADPGMAHIENRGSLERRLLFALAEALLSQEPKA